ncbi:MAG: pitrilysin family protein [Gemmatimonadetes bacterium]|nr:pitrilysin family protein [Gemmatimonadota bacterium]
MSGAPGAASGFRSEHDAGVERTVLPNGLTVVSAQVPGVRSVALGAWVRTASIHETPEQMGVSHMLEHLCFKGSARRSAREIAASLESLGGALDAYTAREHTAFQARVLDEHLPQAADVLVDVMFRPRLREEDLVLERKVVLEEISMVEDTPDDIVFELHNAAMWGDHPYGYSILGTRESVTSLGVDAVRALHARAFVPRNVVVAAAGNVTHDRLIAALATAGWADLPASPPAGSAAPAAAAHVPGFSRVARESAQAHLVFGSATVPHSDPRRHALVLVDMLLGGGMSSRLFQRIREELALAYSVYSFQQFSRDVGVHGIYAGTAPESAEQTLDAVRSELAQLSTSGITADELALAKQQLKGQITLSMESVSSRMYRAAGVELFGEPWLPLDDLLARVDSVTLDATRDVCTEFFAPDRQTVVHLGPQ